MKLRAIAREIGFSLVVLTILLTACEKDYYNPDLETDSQTISDIFGIDFTIPDGFDWSMLQTSAISITVNDNTNRTGSYTVEILADNPIVTSNARLLKKLTISANKTVEANITYPKANTYIYARFTDSEGRKVVKFIDTSKSALAVSYTPASSSSNLTKSAIQTRSTELRSEPTFTELTETSDGAIELDVTRTSITLEAGKKYVLKGTYTGTITFLWDENTYLFIEGTWTNASNLEIRSTKLVVKESGTLINNGNFPLGDFLFYNYGTTTINGNLTGNQTSQIINKGELTINESTSFQGKILNEGILNITGAFSNNSNLFYLKNTNTVTANSLNIQGTIDNYGLFIVNETVEVPTNFTLNIGNGALFKAKQFSNIGNSTINIATNGILEVTEFINFSNTGQVTISGEENSLARLKEIKLATPYVKPIFIGELEVESSVYEDPSSGLYDVGEDVRFVSEGESTVTIPDSGFNKGGNTPNTNNGNENPGTGGNTGGGSGTESGTVDLEYTYAFEDNWPNLGDYDFNDIILHLGTSLTESSESIRSLTITVTLKAVGATIGLGGGIQLTNVNASQVSSVTRSGDIALTGNTFTTSGNLETGQTKAVIPLFDEAHEVFGVSTSEMVNTLPNNNYYTPKTVTITINFNQDVQLTMENIDVFLVNGGTKSNRKEIHRKGYAPTDKVKSNTNGYISEEQNLVWSVQIPGEFKYPLEYINIITAYPDFLNWASSKGENNADWYDYPVSGKIYK
jgi:LruC domain-containing protein